MTYLNHYKIKDNRWILASIPPEHPTLKLIWFIAALIFRVGLFEAQYVYDPQFTKKSWGENGTWSTYSITVAYRVIRHPLDQDYFKNYF